jgi:hypothetical protein
MTAISRKATQRSRSGAGADSTKARLFLAVACVWPLCLMALFAASARHIATSDELNPSSQHRQLGLQFRNILDRVDVMGYGPTHPRVAFALVGSDMSELETSVESILAHTDRNRIFIITVVVEGHAQDDPFVQTLNQLDQGEGTNTRHWHGLRPHIHTGDHTDKDKKDHADQKIHVIFNEQPQGLAKCREDAVHFIQLLETTHESQGLKSSEEDLILVLMQGGTQMVVRTTLEDTVVDKNVLELILTFCMIRWWNHLLLFLALLE